MPFIAGIIVLFSIPLDKDFAYHFVKGECDNKASWMYHRIFEDNRPIDIVFSGASQTGSTIMDDFISKELSHLAGKNIEALNYGYCRRGRDIQYVMLKDLFRHKQPKILVIEVPEDEPKKSHPVFPYLAESHDLFGSFVLFNQRYLISVWKGITVRFERLRIQIMGEKQETSPIDYPLYGYRPSTHIVSKDVVEKNSDAWKHRLDNAKAALIRKIELNYSKHYLTKMAEIAENNNCEVLFLYLSESGSSLKKPLSADFYEQLGELIILPDEIIKNRANWKDATHFNDSGALETSKYLLPTLSEMF